MDLGCLCDTDFVRLFRSAYSQYEQHQINTMRRHTYNIQIQATASSKIKSIFNFHNGSTRFQPWHTAQPRSKYVRSDFFSPHHLLSHRLPPHLHTLASPFRRCKHECAKMLTETTVQRHRSGETTRTIKKGAKDAVAKSQYKLNRGKKGLLLVLCLCLFDVYVYLYTIPNAPIPHDTHTHARVQNPTDDAPLPE